MAFSFGSSKSRSSSSSLDFGAQSSFSESLSEALARSISTGTSSSFSTQRIANADILAQLYQGALSAVPSAGLFQGQAAELFQGGLSILDRLGVGAGQDFLRSRVEGQSPVLDEQIGALSSDLGRFFREELNPAITARAVAGGTLGGGRQGVAQGRAIDAVSREFQRGATELRARDIAARDAAAGALMAGETAAAGTGLAALPGLLGIAESSFAAPLAPFTALAQIIGGPTVLTEAGSQATQFAESTSESIARAISEMFGFNYGQSQSSSKSGGFSFGFGG
jgi:hypothetical protein